MLDRVVRRWLAAMGPCWVMTCLLLGCSSGSGTADGGSQADGGQDGGTVAFRSLLYPPDWDPAFTGEKGRFLHDFSYAGYRNGEVPLSFLLIAGIYVVREFSAGFRDDQIAQSAHLIGGACGSLFGFLTSRGSRPSNR